MTVDQWIHKQRQDIDSYLPMQRKDDRRFPGIVIGWAVAFDETFVRWRVWNGLIDRDEHPTKDCVFGYKPFLDESGWEEVSGACLILYPIDMAQDEVAFVAWANKQSIEEVLP